LYEHIFIKTDLELMFNLVLYFVYGFSRVQGTLMFVLLYLRTNTKRNVTQIFGNLITSYHVIKETLLFLI